MAIQIAIGGDLEIYSSGSDWAKARCTNGAAPDWTTEVEVDGDGLESLAGIVTDSEWGFAIHWNDTPSDYRLLVITHGGGDGIVYGDIRDADNGDVDWQNLESAHKCRIVSIKWLASGLATERGRFTRPGTGVFTFSDCAQRVKELIEWIHSNLNQRNVPIALIGSSGGADAVLSPFTLQSSTMQRIHYVCPSSYPVPFWDTYNDCHAITPPNTFVDPDTGDLTNDPSDVGCQQSGVSLIDSLLTTTECSLGTVSEEELAGFSDKDNLDAITPWYRGTLHVTVGQFEDIDNSVIWAAGGLFHHAFWQHARRLWFSSKTDGHGDALADVTSEGFAEVHRELASLADTLGGNMSAMSDYLEVELRMGLFRTNTYSQRANSTAYSVGDRVYLATFDAGFYECVTAGNSAASPPAFDTDIGDTTTDGTVTWRRILPGIPKKSLWVALYTAAPSDSGGGTEVSGGSYARVRVDPVDANWSAPDATGGLTDNVGAITFPTPSANWGVITHMGVHDHPTAGNLLFHGALAQAKTVNNGDPAPSFPAGSLDITLA